MLAFIIHPLPIVITPSGPTQMPWVSAGDPRRKALTWLIRGYGATGELQAWGVAPGFKVNQTLGTATGGMVSGVVHDGVLKLIVRMVVANSG